MANAVKTLRREVTQARGVEDGTIVRFTRTISARRDEMAMQDRPELVLTYAAIWVAGAWWFTGAGALGRSRMTQREFTDYLARPDVSGVAVATEFEVL